MTESKDNDARPTRESWEREVIARAVERVQMADGGRVRVVSLLHEGRP